MNLRRTLFIVSLLFLAATTSAAELKDCIKLVQKGDSATLTNICSDMINMIYCVDNSASPRTCSGELDRVVTLVPNGVEIIPEFGGGKSEIYSALCVYPQAPIGWKPGPSNPYTCKKTCVMC
jgi:hypothetical protein